MIGSRNKEGEQTMVQSRIREIRREKGLTLQEIADRAGTTAQTIGRLETGMRTLSIKWVNRIAEALGVQPAVLLSLPEQGDIEISGEVSAKGGVAEKKIGTVSLRLSARQPIALKIKNNMGEYREGDAIICEGHGSTKAKSAIGKDCLVELKNGARAFAKLASGSKADTYTLIPVGNSGALLENCQITFAAPVVTLVRTFSA